jgi:hypothetical protein
LHEGVFFDGDKLGLQVSVSFKPLLARIALVLQDDFLRTVNHYFSPVSKLARLSLKRIFRSVSSRNCGGCTCWAGTAPSVSFADITHSAGHGFWQLRRPL